MKATIGDSSALQALSPIDLTSYLRTRGWHQRDAHQKDGASKRGSIWEFSADPSIEVLVPLDSSLRDFSQRISDALTTLSVVEERSQLDLYRDITSSAYDLIRVQAIDADYAQGTMPVTEAVALVERARDLLLSAACAASSPRMVFHTRKPTQALDYMKNVRMGQTEIGSFVITLQSPVTPTLKENLPGSPPPDDPFERRVTQTLTRALHAAEGASRESAAKGSIAPFEEAYMSGVSANFCDAIVNLYEVARAQSLGVGVSWAAIRPRGEDAVPSHIVIPRDSVPILKEVSRVFRARKPDPEAEVRGCVIKLERREGETAGVATVYGMAGGSVRNVRIRLQGSDYEVALEAHSREAVVRAVGELRRQGRGYDLVPVRAFEILETEEDEAP